MEWKDLIIGSYDGAFRAVGRALDGLTQKELDWQPRPDSNSIGWTTWHLARAQDGLISCITGEEQLWIRDGWYAKFNRPADPNDSGYGHSQEEVAAFKSPDVNTLLDYHRAVLERSKQCLANLSVDDLDRKIDDFLSQMFPTVGSRLVVILDEILQHTGQVCYIRGLLQGSG
jgi:hypothetical protein